MNWVSWVSWFGFSQKRTLRQGLEHRQFIWKVEEKEEGEVKEKRRGCYVSKLVPLVDTWS